MVRRVANIFHNQNKTKKRRDRGTKIGISSVLLSQEWRRRQILWWVPEMTLGQALEARELARCVPTLDRDATDAFTAAAGVILLLQVVWCWARPAGVHWKAGVEVGEEGGRGNVMS
ncbi:hypothetical protein PoB_002395700 [Plakobranchus ocellatus]|uniref:Uncharacterized protein n=1 Tax=Plakobranchus ocellatus TaxID=259542 RepID=A0AAV3ZS11_9GAST|nr:hypothetical protein PoB_002395700 [Plakobranchus ocellatus]